MSLGWFSAVGYVEAGTSSSVNALGAGRLVSLHCDPGGSAGTVTFTGGSLNGVVVTLSTGKAFDWSPGTVQDCKSITFSVPMDWLVEWA